MPNWQLSGRLIDSGHDFVVAIFRKVPFLKRKLWALKKVPKDKKMPKMF
jgi:hypothetical protein